MRNAIKQFGIIAVAALIILSMAACPSPTGGGGGGPAAPRTAVYVSADDAGNRYTLEITESLQNRAASYAAKKGDPFKLTVELLKGANYDVALVYSGTVDSTAGNETQIIINLTVNGKPLGITIKGVEMTVIEGDIVVSDGSTVKPGALETIFTSSATLSAWLALQPANTKDNPYKVKVAVVVDTLIYDIGTVPFVLARSDKYVYLDLSLSTITSIDQRVFMDSELITGIKIPAGVTSISAGAFINSPGLTKIDVDAANPAYSSDDGVLYNKARTVLVRYLSTKPGSTFTIPSSVTTIGEMAFAYNGYGLASITIPNSVTTIERAAFSHCYALTSVTIPDSVTTIGENNFAACVGLTSVTIGNGVTSIWDGAFFECNGLTSVTIPVGVTSIERSAFFNCSGLTSVTIPSGVTTLGEYSFGFCRNLASVTFQGTIPSSGFASDAFANQGDLRAKFYATNAANGTPGTYTRSLYPITTWTKQ